MDLIGDMLTRIRNGEMAKKAMVSVLYSKLNLEILNVLKNEGYIADFKAVDIREKIKEIQVFLKANSDATIKEIKRVSKSSRRVYISAKGLPFFYNGLGIYILSTSKGVMSDYQARAQNVGGEIICSVF